MEITLTDVQQKALEVTATIHNDELLRGDPKAVTKSPEEYLQFIVESVADSWAKALGFDRPDKEQKASDISTKLAKLDASAIYEVAALVDAKVAALPIDAIAEPAQAIKP